MGANFEITETTRAGRKSKWMLDYYSPWELDEQGRRKRKKESFPTKEKRTERRQALEKKWAQFGQSAGNPMTPGEVEDFRGAKEILPAGITMRQAASFYVARHPVGSVKWSDLVTACYKEIEAGDASKKHWKRIKATGEAFADEALQKDTLATDITSDDVARWLKMRKSYADSSLKQYRGDLVLIFRYGLRKKLLKENPLADIKPPATVWQEPEFFTVPEMRAILAAAFIYDRPMVAYIALRAFAGIRREELLRVKDVVIDRKGKVIDLPGFEKLPSGKIRRITKTKRRRIIEGVPDVIWQWLEVAKLDTRNERKRMARIIELSGVTAKRNALRHGFATYFVALKQSASEAMLILGHEDDSKAFFDHYRGYVTKAEAEAYCSISPSSVLPWVGRGDVKSLNRLEPATAWRFVRRKFVLV